MAGDSEFLFLSKYWAKAAVIDIFIAASISLNGAVSKVYGTHGKRSKYEISRLDPQVSKLVTDADKAGQWLPGLGSASAQYGNLFVSTREGI